MPQFNDAKELKTYLQAPISHLDIADFRRGDFVIPTSYQIKQAKDRDTGRLENRWYVLVKYIARWEYVGCIGIPSGHKRDGEFLRFYHTARSKYEVTNPLFNLFAEVWACLLNNDLPNVRNIEISAADRDYHQRITKIREAFDLAEQINDGILNPDLTPVLEPEPPKFVEVRMGRRRIIHMPRRAS